MLELAKFFWRTPGDSVKMIAFLGKTERLRKTFSFTSSLSFFFSHVLPLLHLYFPLSALSSPLLCFLFLHLSLSAVMFTTILQKQKLQLPDWCFFLQWKISAAQPSINKKAMIRPTIWPQSKHSSTNPSVPCQQRDHRQAAETSGMFHFEFYTKVYRRKSVILAYRETAALLLPIVVRFWYKAQWCHRSSHLN